MKYKYIANQYFSFSSSMSTQSFDGKNKQRINITGKPNKNVVIVYLIFAFFLTMFAYAINENKFGNSTINIFQGIFGVTSTMRINPQLLFVVIAIMCVSVLIVFIKSKIVFKKLEPKPTNINIYERELPSKLRPAHVRMLINDGLVDEISLSATIMDLIDKEYLRIKNGMEFDNKLNLFKNSQITLVKTEKDTNNLLKYEQYIIDWFINKYGNGEEVAQETVHQKLLFENDASEEFEEWQALVYMSFPVNKYFNKIKSNRMIYVILVIFGFIPIIPFIGQFLGIYGLGCLLFASPMYNLNQNGVDEGSKWLNLKKFLNDFMDIENKTAESVEIWDFYLTYSIALNISSVALKEIKDFFGDNIFKGNNQFANNKIQADVKNIEELQQYYKGIRESIELDKKQFGIDVQDELKKYDI